MTKSELKDIIKECLNEVNYVSTVKEATDIEFIDEDTNIELVDEAAIIFISKEGKELKQKIKDILKENRAKTSVTDKVLYTASLECAKEISKKIMPIISKLFTSAVHSTAPTKVYGIDDYITYHAGIVNGKAYSFSLKYNTSGASLFSYSETDTNDAKATLPINAANYAIKNCDDKYALGFGKNRISASNISDGSINKNLYNEIVKKYPNAKISGVFVKFS